MPVFIFFPFILLSLILTVNVDGTYPKITVHKDGWLMDEFNRYRIFHGVNVVQKGGPWYPSKLLNTTKLAQLKKWGFNVMRLGMMWSGANPKKGVYNSSYIQISRKIIDLLGIYGMSVVLDMHQDLISNKYGSYDGVPRWLIDEFPLAEHPFPWPLGHHEVTWADGYISQAMGVSFQCLYNNTKSAVVYWGRFWQYVAKYMKDVPNVLGYELINEPWAGDIYQKPSLVLPGVTGKDNLMPAYHKLAAYIHTVDKEKLIFYEPVTWGVFATTGEFGTGFTTVPGGSSYANRSVLSYHYYCQILGQGELPYPVWLRILCDEISLMRMFRSVIGTTKITGGGAFMTEFGACFADDKPDRMTIECDTVLAKADDFFQSWTFWDYSFFHNNTSGEVNQGMVHSFSRAYARAVAGLPTKMSFNKTTVQFQLEFVPDPKITQPTEIWLPSFRYTNGFTVSASEGLKWTFDSDNSLLHVTLSKQLRDVILHRESVSSVKILIKPKAKV